MIQRWSNVEETVDTINHQVENYLQDHQLTAADIRLSSETTDEVLKCISDDTIYMLRRNSVTGVFVILSDLQEQETTVENHSGFYLRDLDPESNPSDNSDLMIERAPSNVTKYLGIPLDSWWTPLFTLDADTQSSSYSDFYYQPYRAALEHPEMEYQDLGYWSRPFSLSGEDISVISYSVPLRLADGSVYGVLGVEISLDYLRSQMPYQEILPQSHGAYLLAIQNEEGLYVVITTSGPVYKELFGEENSLAIDRETSEENIFVLKKSERSDAKSYGCVEPLQLYNTNTPFEQDQWVLLGVVKDQTLLSFSQNVELLILVSAAVSLAIGIVGILILSTMLTLSLIHI